MAAPMGTTRSDGATAMKREAGESTSATSLGASLFCLSVCRPQYIHTPLFLIPRNTINFMLPTKQQAATLRVATYLHKTGVQQIMEAALNAAVKAAAPDPVPFFRDFFEKLENDKLKTEAA